MGLYELTVGAPNGFQVDYQTGYCWNRTGGSLTAKALVFLDHGLASTEATTYDTGAQTSGEANLIDPTTALIATRPAAVIVDEAVADNGRVLCHMKGRILAAVEADGAGGGIAPGDLLYAENATNVLTDVAAGKPYARALATIAQGSSGTILVDFNGDEGF